jgi:carbonic anhydrase
MSARLLMCDAIAVTCIDFRFQARLEQWLNQTLGSGNYDRVALAGGVQNWEVVLPQIELARRLHRILRVILINHEECGAYGADGTPERHAADLRQMRTRIVEKFPDLVVELYFARLYGTIERVS